MIEYKEILGTVAVVIALVGYVPYFRDIFRRKIKFRRTSSAEFFRRWQEDIGADSSC